MANIKMVESTEKWTELHTAADGRETTLSISWKYPLNTKKFMWRFLLRRTWQSICLQPEHGGFKETVLSMASLMMVPGVVTSELFKKKYHAALEIYIYTWFHRFLQIFYYYNQYVNARKSLTFIVRILSWINKSDMGVRSGTWSGSPMLDVLTKVSFK